MDPPSSLLSLPDDVLFIIAGYLDVQATIQFLRVGRRLSRLFTQNQHMWYLFCVEKCFDHIELLDDIKSPDYRRLYAYLHNKSNLDVASYLQFNWLQKRLNLTIRDPSFLQIFLHLYAARNTKNEIKQVMYLDQRVSNKKDGIYTMKFKMCPNQQLFNVFFYGERLIYSTMDLVVVGRALDPREIKIMEDVMVAQRAPRNSGWNFTNSGGFRGSPRVNVKCTPLSSSQLQKIGVETTMQRTLPGNHEIKYDNTETTNQRLRESSSVRHYNVGEVLDLEVIISIQVLFSSIVEHFVAKS